MKRVLTLAKDGRPQPVWIPEYGVPAIALETEAACRAVSVSEYTLRKWVREGRLAPRDLGNKKLWLVDELLECVKSLPPWYKGNDQENQEVGP